MWSRYKVGQGGGWGGEDRVEKWAEAFDEEKPEKPEVQAEPPEDQSSNSRQSDVQATVVAIASSTSRKKDPDTGDILTVEELIGLYSTDYSVGELMIYWENEMLHVDAEGEE